MGQVTLFHTLAALRGSYTRARRVPHTLNSSLNLLWPPWHTLPGAANNRDEEEGKVTRIEGSWQKRVPLSLPAIGQQ